jgi:hypothetical protein
MLWIAMISALALFVFVIAYKYTGDFSGFAKFGTSDTQKH